MNEHERFFRVLSDASFLTSVVTRWIDEVSSQCSSLDEFFDIFETEFAKPVNIIIKNSTLYLIGDVLAIPNQWFSKDLIECIIDHIIPKRYDLFHRIKVLTDGSFTLSKYKFMIFADESIIRDRLRETFRNAIRVSIGDHERMFRV